ncbi:hypothetical protein LWI29_026092 [Acer saccharum]|uniref:C-JID domain-containing protein n=1 Tax=Acer saccharum TaxID=4024 RepID=A0AA39SN55_ACESA|nr:hypothetical protein LWI29_026092 [Acer saccharum]
MRNLEDIDLSSQVFDEMYNLRFLLIHNSTDGSNKVHFPNGLNCIPGELRILNWRKCPLRVLPSNFNSNELVKLDLSGSNIEQLWDVTKPAPKLKWLDLSWCENLTRIPNLSDFPLLVEGSGMPPNEFRIYLPGNKIPEWFSYQSLESSINIKVLRNDLVNSKFMGFAICVVFGVDENNTCELFTLGVGCVIKTCNVHWHYRTQYWRNLPNVFIDSDHMLLGYCSFYSGNLMKLPAGDSDYVDISIEFKMLDDHNQLKRCAVHPIYAEEPIEIIGATIQEIGETSGRRSD